MSDINKIDDWIQMVKEQKMLWVKEQKNPDQNPTVFVERKGIIRAIIVAPQLDKWQGLHAAKVCRVGFGADALTLVFDAHVAHGKPGESKEDFAKQFPPGSMQRMCDEEGACKTRKITDCMICHRITADGHLQMVTLPYFYDEKYQGEFHWLDDEIMKMDTKEEGVGLEGTIPENLKAIMAQPTLLEIPEMNAQREFMQLEPERALYHGGRAIMTILNQMGFLCFHLEEKPKSLQEEEKAEEAEAKE
jgi:hypothetical protein